MHSKLPWARLLGLCVALGVACVACDDAAKPATQIVVSITSDLGTDLTRVEMTLATSDGDDVVAMQDFAVVAEDPDEGQFVLPITFSIGKGDEDSFRLVVTGYGPLGTGGEEIKIVEQKVIASFQDDEALLLKVFLGRICVEDFCDDDPELVCYPAGLADVARGECGPIPELGPDELPRINVDKPPDFAIPPDGVGPDGGMFVPDAGFDSGVDGGFDAGCVGDCPCRSATDCNDRLFCTVDSCDVASGECSNDAYTCPDDSNDCTSGSVCNEDTDSCDGVFDPSSLTSDEHCGASATSACIPCMDDATRTAMCGAGSCAYTCVDGRHEADGDLSNGCECVFMNAIDDEDDAALDTNCDGADGEVDGIRFVYVTPGGAGLGDGSSPADAATLLAAFTYAETTSRNRLLLAAGDYLISSPLAAPDGLVMFGGYAADFRSRSGASNVLASSPSALSIVNAVLGVTVDSVNFTTASQTTPAGAYTHTIDVNNSTNVEFARLTVTAGAGANGAPGTTGTSGANVVTLGGAGASAPSFSTGGAGGASAGSVGAGGDGGKGGDVAGGLAQAGVQGSNGTAIGVNSCGIGGGAGPAQNLACVVGNILYSGDHGMPGNPGCTGASGSHGAGGIGAGAVANDGSWLPTSAATGNAGITGGSGGGGGGGGGVTCSLGSAGGGGGEGGAGGGAGLAGGAGGPGGASIGFLVRVSSIRLAGVTIVTASGGTGGTGGSGGVGGTGADGGAYGSGLTNGTNPSVRGGHGGLGGKGGSGGKGGCGGSGAGGPSVGIFGEAGTQISGTPIYQIGAGGAAGAVCAVGGGNVGSMGVVAETRGF